MQAVQPSVADLLAKPAGDVFVEIAGFTFRLSSAEPVWPVGGIDLVHSLTGSCTDFCVRLVSAGSVVDVSRFERCIETNSLTCYLDTGSEDGEICVAVSPVAFRASPLSFLELITRITLIVSGRAYPLHACGLQARNVGLVFAGPSDAGKTTMAALWQQSWGATVFSDERVWLRRLEDGSYWVYGAPLQGPKRFYQPGGARIDKILLLRHGSSNKARRSSGVEALTSLLPQAHLRIYHQLGLELPLDFYVDLVRQVPCYDLQFRPDAAIVDYVLDLG